MLNHAAYLRNSNLIEQLLQKFSVQLFANDTLHENIKGNTPLHLAVAIKRHNQLELPKIEEMLISKCKYGSMLLHKNKAGHNPLMVALIKGSESENDPINSIKLMLESTYCSELLMSTDSLGNTPLHLAAKLDSIPLALSLIFNRTPFPRRYLLNGLGNTPLSEAILNEVMGNALFIL